MFRYLISWTNGFDSLANQTELFSHFHHFPRNCIPDDDAEDQYQRLEITITVQVSNDATSIAVRISDAIGQVNFIAVYTPSNFTIPKSM